MPQDRSLVLRISLRAQLHLDAAAILIFTSSFTSLPDVTVDSKYWFAMGHSDPYN